MLVRYGFSSPCLVTVKLPQAAHIRLAKSIQPKTTAEQLAKVMVLYIPAAIANAYVDK